MAGLQSVDILINSSLGVQFARRDSKGKFDTDKPATIAETFRPATGDPVSILYDSFENGGGFSRRWLPKTYDRASNLHMRTPTIVLPSGLTTELTLPAAISGQAYPIVGPCVLRGNVYIACGRFVAVSSLGTGAFTADAIFPANFVAKSIVTWDNDVFVSGVDSTNNNQPLGIWKRGTGWTQSADVKRYLLAEDPVYWVRKTVGRQVWISTSSTGTWSSFYQHLPLGLDPMVEANWSAQILVGRTSEFPINSIGIAPRHVLFGKPEGLFDVDERDFTPNYTPWFRQSYEQTNGSQLAVLSSPSGAAAYISHYQGLHRVILNEQRQTASQPCGPGTGTPTTTPAFGAPTALCTDGSGWIAAAFHDGEDAYVWYGRDREEMGVQTPGPVVWHGSECDLSGQRVSSMRIVSVNGNPKLFIGSQDNGGGTVRMHSQSIPIGVNPLQDYLWPTPTSRVADGFHEFAEEGSLYLPEEDFNAPMGLKVLRKLKILAPGASSSITQEMFASIDQGAYVSQGTAETPYWTQIPLAASQAGRSIKLKLTGTGTRRVPFRLQAVEVDADVIVEQSSVLEIPIIVAQFQPRSTGVPSGRDQDGIWTQLIDMAATQGVVDVQVRGIKQTFRAKILPFAGRTVVQDREGRPWYMTCTLKLDVVDPPAGYLIWDGGTPWDSAYGYVS